MYFEAAWFCKGRDVKGEDLRNFLGERGKSMKVFSAQGKTDYKGLNFGSQPRTH